MFEKTENKQKEAGMAHFLKKEVANWIVNGSPFNYVKIKTNFIHFNVMTFIKAKIDYV